MHLPVAPRRVLPALALALTVLGGLPACTGPNPAETVYVTVGAPPPAPYIEGEVVVRFPPGMTRADVDARLAPWGGVVLDGAFEGEVGPSDTERTNLVDGLLRLGLPAGMPVEEAEGLLALDGETLFIEPNYIVNAFRTPNDPRYGELWGMARIDAPGAWDRTTGSADVIVAVIDTGLDYTHPDLRDRAWRNPGETAGNGVDDDRNGYVDDVYGWDFCNNDSNPMDDHGHGTHCGGTITGTGNNAVGVAGVSWNARVLGLKFLCANGSGSTYAASLAVRYAADMRFALTSNSWGGGGFSQALYDTILYAQGKNQLFVAAAGNDGQNIDAANSYPAGYDLPNIVSVAASDSGDARASFSNYGATRVDLAAPGVGILSTLPNNGYAAWSGTSMATPHVSGALGLYYAAHPGAGWADARAALLAAVDPVAAWRGVVATGGRLNVGRLLAGAAPAPAAPTGVRVVGDGSDAFKVSWNAPADSSVTHHLVYARKEGGEVRPAQRADASPARVSPVSVGTWQVSVAAINPTGASPRSVEVPFVVADAVPPGRVLDLTVRGPVGAPVEVRRAVATSDFGEGWGAEYAVDGDPLTGWAARPEVDPADARLRFALGDGVVVGRVTVDALPGFEALLPPGIEVRALFADGWTVLASELAPPLSGRWSWDFAPVQTDTLELRITEFAEHVSGLSYAVIGEVGLYAPPSDPGALEIAFTAPGDDGAAGTAAAYDLRVAPGLTEGGFDAAPRVALDPPAPPGTREVRTVGGLPSQTTLGLSLAAVDEVGLRGAPSPVVFATTGALPPGAPQDAVIVSAGADFVELSFTAPADDGLLAASGPAGRYEIRWSDRPITAATWPGARLVEGPAPAAPGAVQRFRVTGLPAAPRHHLRIAALDRAGLRGPWTDDLAADAPAGPDATPPAAVGALTASYEAGSAEPAPLGGEAALVDGDPETGWMLDGAPGATLSQVFSLGDVPQPLTQVVLLPHTLFPGDMPVTAAVRTQDPRTGAWTEQARVNAVAPGAPLVLSMPPVDVTRFTLDLVVGPARFGVAVVALGEVSAERALPGGGRARLTWVAPGDDAWLGRAVEYDLRRAGAEMATLEAFAAGTRLELPPPAEGGSLEVATLPELGEGARFFFSLRARDDAGAWGALGNSARLDVPPVPPGAIRDLRVVSVERNAVELSFTAPGDDGYAGRAARYDLRFVPGALTEGRFADAQAVPTPPPAPAGTMERVRIEGLSPGTLYGFGVVAVDAGGAAGALGPAAAATTLEAIAPAAVADLRAEAGSTADRALLRFTAPGDDAAVGRATRYDLRFGEAPLTPANFAAAQAVAAPAPQLAGSAEVVTAAGLSAERRYFFALTATDDVGNVSGLSNVATWDTPAVPPAAIDDLRVTGRELDGLVMAFTAPGDDGAVGQATSYDLRWSRAPITTEAEFLAATRAVTPVPQVAGRAESVRVGALPEGTRLYLAILARDERGAASPRSASVAGDTLDRTAPGRVVDLTGTAVAAATSLSFADARSSSALMLATGPDALVDENPSTLWISALREASTPEWVLLDLGAPAVIDRLVLRPAAGYAAQFPAALRISTGTGDPDQPGDLLLDEVGLTVAEDATLERRFAPVEARWLRLNMAGTMDFGADSLLALGGVEVYAADPGLRSVELAFTAPADVGPTGRVARYDLRVAPHPFDPARFDSARALGGPAPQAPGLPQRFTATALAPETRFGFALVAFDADDNRSAVSNVAVVTTRGVPPTTVVDLRADAPEETALTLRFTAPSDAGAPAARYELRRSDAPLNADNFGVATPIATNAPAAPGSAETVRLTGLTASTTYWFALRSADAGGEVSALSNVLAVRTADPPERIPPSRVRDLTAVTAQDTDGAVALTWTAPGDDGVIGRATRYELRWSPTPLNADTFAAATLVATPAPQAAGGVEHVTVTGLPWERTAHFALRAIDDTGNVSDLSNPASAATRAVPPSTIADLRIERDATTAVLRFTAPGADRGVGRATRYEVFVETRTFASPVGLTPWAGAPAPQPAGAAEVLRVPDRPADTTTYAAVRALDDAGNAGALSPVVSVVFPDIAAPAAPEAVSVFTGVERGTLRLRFRAPGDDAFEGTPARYEVRYGEAAFAPFTAGTAYAGALTVVPGGTAADLILRGLPDERPIFVALRAVDNADTAGAASAPISARTPDVPPARIVDLRAASAGPSAVDLTWSAPGDDGAVGRATRYEVRRADAALGEANWAAATVLAGPPAPVVSGAAQTMRVGGLQDGRTYHFAVRAFDERDNASPVSNDAFAATDDTTAPGVVNDLRVEGEPGRPDALRLHWTAAGDDGDAGTARRIDVRVATGAWPGWLAATLVPVTFTPGVAGAAQTKVISGLDPETRYIVALSTVDEVGNAADASNRAVGTTGDAPPGAPARFSVVADGPGALRMSFTAPADNGVDAASGPVDRYEIQVATREIADFTGGIAVLPGPAPGAPGSAQSHRLTGLADDTEHWVVVRALDAAGNRGASSVVATAKTPDVAAPGHVITLVAQPPQTDADPVATGVAQASDTLSAAWPAEAAFDGDPDSAWAAPPAADGAAPSVSVLLDGRPLIGGLRLFVGDWAEQFPTDFELLLDGDSVARYAGLEPVAGQWVELSFEPRAAARVALVVHDVRDPGGYVVVPEVEVLPADDPADSVRLTWVAPGDNADTGTATRYELRVSERPIDAGNFAAARLLPAPAPAAAGRPQSVRVEDLAEDTAFHFALLAIDDAGNRGAVSNDATARTGGVPPEVVTDLTATPDGADAVLVEFTAPADPAGVADYDLRFRAGALGDPTWDAATRVATPAPAAPGTTQRVRVTGLLPGTGYAFGLRATDARGATSRTSNVAFALTAPGADVTAPGAVGELRARAVAGDGRALRPTRVSASGAQFPDLVPAAAVDADPATAWATPPAAGAGEEWIRLTFAAPVAIDTLRLRAAVGLADLFPADFVVEGTQDGTTFAPLVTVTGHVADPARAAAFSFDPTPVTDLRLRAQRAHRADRFFVVVAEVEVFEAAAPDAVTLTFVAPGDDGDVGRAALYRVARAAAPLTVGNWAAADVVDADLAPLPAGAPQAIVLTGLPVGRHFFAVRAVDEVGQLGAVGASVEFVVR